jgi:hypothetical protein
VANEFPEDQLPEDKEPKALPKELIESYTLFEKQLEQNVLAKVQIQQNVDQIQKKVRLFQQKH